MHPLGKATIALAALALIGKGVERFIAATAAMAASEECANRGRDQRGATAVEYGLLIAGVFLACLVGIKALGVTFGEEFRHQNDNLGPTQVSSSAN